VTAVRKRVVVSGRVQGVFFRDSCRRRALDEGVSGWVANTDAGEVEACFEGDRDAVERLVEWCRTGPPAARVDSISVEDEQPRGTRGFEVR
jgi:acylphosphatase